MKTATFILTQEALCRVLRIPSDWTVTDLVIDNLRDQLVLSLRGDRLPCRDGGQVEAIFSRDEDGNVSCVRWRERLSEPPTFVG